MWLPFACTRGCWLGVGEGAAEREWVDGLWRVGMFPVLEVCLEFVSRVPLLRLLPLLMFELPFKLSDFTRAPFT